MRRSFAAAFGDLNSKNWRNSDAETNSEQLDRIEELLIEQGRKMDKVGLTEFGSEYLGISWGREEDRAVLHRFPQFIFSFHATHTHMHNIDSFVSIFPFRVLSLHLFPLSHFLHCFCCLRAKRRGTKRGRGEKAPLTEQKTLFPLSVCSPFPSLPSPFRSHFPTTYTQLWLVLLPSRSRTSSPLDPQIEPQALPSIILPPTQPPTSSSLVSWISDRFRTTLPHALDTLSDRLTRLSRGESVSDLEPILQRILYPLSSNGEVCESL